MFDYENPKFICVDYETFWDVDFTLSKMPTAQYVRDPRFEPMSVAVTMADRPSEYHFGAEGMREFLAQFPFEDPEYITVAHNARFDGSILEWHHGIKPARYFCTQFAANAIVKPFTGSSSLASVSRYYNMGKKGDLNTKGKHCDDLLPHERRELRTYNIQDTVLNFGIATMLWQELVNRNPSGEELDHIHYTVTKFTRPQLYLDEILLRKALDETVTETESIIAASGVSRVVLNSTAKLAAAFELLGVTPEQKVTAKNKVTYAFAKDDPGMLKLMGHDDERVRKLAHARVAAKSTLMESRLRRLIALREQSIELPVPLVYYAAHTGRYGGGDFINLQNAKRGSALRYALHAPEGHKVVAGDLSQIEARITATWSRQWDLVEDFANNVDVYSKFATRLYGYEVNKEQHDANERFVGKTCILSLGFGAGFMKLFHTVHYKYGKKSFQPNDARDAVDTYRETYRRIQKTWQWLNGIAIPAMATGKEVERDGLLFGKHHVRLPNGMRIEYPGLRGGGGEAYYVGRNGYDFMTGELKPATPIKLYGGKLMENIVQSMARIVVTTAEAYMAKFGFQAALSVHDELVYVVPDRIANKFAMALDKAMSRTIDWMPACPVTSSVKIAQSYGDAK